MEQNKEYKRIYVYNNINNDYEVLKGKVVDKISLAVSNESYDMNELIITFTDKTYIAFGIDDVSEGYDEERKTVLSNSFICHPSSWNLGNFKNHIKVLSNGELKFDPLIENRIKLGLWNVTMEEQQKIIKEDEKRQEEQEFKRYLYLKNKFKDRENEFKNISI